MSQITLSSNASGTGIFTIASPNSNTNRTLNLPDSAGTFATSESTLAQFNASGSAPVYACRAWVNFNGTGTVAIRASGNVSSITDNATGDYTVNFTTAMPDANYSATISCGNAVGVALRFSVLNLGRSYSVSSFSLNTTNTSFITADENNINVSIFR